MSIGYTGRRRYGTSPLATPLSATALTLSDIQAVCPGCGGLGHVEEYDSYTTTGDPCRKRLIRCQKPAKQRCPSRPQIIEMETPIVPLAPQELKDRFKRLTVKNKPSRVAAIACVNKHTVSKVLYGEGMSTEENLVRMEQAVTQLELEDSPGCPDPDAPTEVDHSMTAYAESCLADQAHAECESQVDQAEAEEAGADNCVLVNPDDESFYIGRHHHQEIDRVFLVARELAELPKQAWQLAISLAEIELQRQEVHSQVIKLFSLSEVAE